MMNHHAPAYPAPFFNDTNTLATAPNGQLVAPFSTVQLQGLSRLDVFTLHAMAALIQARAVDDAFAPAEHYADEPAADVSEGDYIAMHAVAIASATLKALRNRLLGEGFQVASGEQA